jgi:hypothetical protein
MMKKLAVLLMLLFLTVYAGCSQNKEQENDLSADETALVSESTETTPPETKAAKATTTTAATTTATEQTTEPPAEQTVPPVAQEQAAPPQVAPAPVEPAPAPPPAPSVSSNEQKAIQTCESLGLVRDTSINYANADFAWGYALHGDTPIVNQVQQMQCGGYFNYFQHTDGFYYVGLIFDLSNPKAGATWVFTQSDVDWIIGEAQNYTESIGMTYYPRGDLSNKDNGSWANEISNMPNSTKLNSKQGVLDDIRGRIEYYKSKGYTAITVDYQLMISNIHTTNLKRWGNGLYDFYVIYA